MAETGTIIRTFQLTYDLDIGAKFDSLYDAGNKIWWRQNVVYH
jgi:hypothetical protein